MNIKFNIKDFQMDVEDNPIQIGELSMELTDFQASDVIQISKNLPHVMKKIKEDIQVDTLNPVASKPGMQSIFETTGRLYAKLPRFHNLIDEHMRVNYNTSIISELSEDQMLDFYNYLVDLKLKSNR